MTPVVGRVVRRTTGHHTDMVGATGHYSTHRLVEIMNSIPRGAGCHVRHADDRGGNNSAAQSLPEAPSGAVWMGGGRDRARGRSVVWAMHLLPAGGPSGLGDLLAPGGAGWEPGGGALLRAEAVLVLQGEGAEQHSQGARTAEKTPQGLGQAGGGPEDTGRAALCTCTRTAGVSCARARRAGGDAFGAAGGCLVCDSWCLPVPAHPLKGELSAPAALKAAVPAADAHSCPRAPCRPPADGPHAPAAGGVPRMGRDLTWASRSHQAWGTPGLAALLSTS